MSLYNMFRGQKPLLRTTPRSSPNLSELQPNDSDPCVENIVAPISSDSEHKSIGSENMNLESVDDPLVNEEWTDSSVEEEQDNEINQQDSRQSQNSDNFCDNGREHSNEEPETVIEYATNEIGPEVDENDNYSDEIKMEPAESSDPEAEETEQVVERKIDPVAHESEPAIDDSEPTIEESVAAIDGSEPTIEESVAAVEDNERPIQVADHVTLQIGSGAEKTKIESEPVEIETDEETGSEEVEPWIEQIGDHQNQGKCQIFDTLCMLKELRLDGPGDDLGIKDTVCLHVPTKLILCRGKDSFFCEFKIKNTSEHKVYYVVTTSNPEKFEIVGVGSRDWGILVPLAEGLVKIQTFPDVVKEYGDFATDKFKVVGLPVKILGSNLRHMFLEDYLKVYGTIAFPSVITEVHEIKLVPENLTNYSWLDLIAIPRRFLGNPDKYFNPCDKHVEYAVPAYDGIAFAQNKEIISTYMKHLKERDNRINTSSINFSNAVLATLLVIGVIWLSFIVVAQISSNFNWKIQVLEKMCTYINCPYCGIQYPPPPKTWAQCFCLFWNKITFGWGCQN